MGAGEPLGRRPSEETVAKSEMIMFRTRLVGPGELK